MYAAHNELAGLEGDEVTNTYGNRGMSFESLIEYANRQYRQDGIAVIEKQHTLCKPLRNGTGRIVSAKYEEKATVDFMGRYGERPIAFEAKHCSADKIDLKRVAQHQCRFLQEWTAEPAAIGFVIISFRLSAFYLIPWDYWQAALDAREKRTGGTVIQEPVRTEWQTTGKASIRMDELPAEWEIKLGGRIAIDYLAAVRKLWKLE